MELNLRAEDAKDWIYKGEGAANIVLSYNGSSVSLLGKVLRIQKIPSGHTKSTNGCSLLSMHEKLLWRNIGELVEAASKEIVGQVFMLHVMGPLLGPKHVDGGVRIIVSKEFLESVRKNVHTQRPAWRVDASEVDILCGSALLIPDHSIILRNSGILKEEVSFAIEIKPKCGFLPSSEFIAKSNAIKKHVTRFRMHQIFKLHQGEISQLSQYNPLDLFSGKRERIYQAILALFAAPQNNFRVFFNGSLIFGGSGGMDNAVLSFHDTNGEFKDLTKIIGLHLASFQELIADAVFSSAVLDMLLVAQKLDVFDIEGAIHAYYNIISQPCIACKTSSDSDIHNGYSFIHSISMEESLKIVRDYLVAATAKDCSLMISFRPVEERDTSDCNSLFLKSSEQSFEYRVNFIDLDMKPLQKMVHYYELDQKIVKFCTRYMQNGYCNGTNFSDEGQRIRCEQ